mgnify:CR=1 FL=1
MALVYMGAIHMLEGINDEELKTYLEENPRILPRFDIDFIETVDTYITPAALDAEDGKPNIEALMELCGARDAFDREMASQRRPWRKSI